MGWTNWVLFRFVNKTVDDTLKLKFPNTNDHWDYPFAGTKDTNTRGRIEYSDIQQVDIEPKGSYSYGQTGKPNTFAGMEGTVDIYTKAAAGREEEKIARIFYSCSRHSPKNKFTISDTAPGYQVTQWGADLWGDALGSIKIEVRRI
ncbi:hypothetical protein NCS56_00972300 [Fusarium sp. Ph1]|nr:hypothetical protein NCS56_00972300 [Fusarium sp. Ph1]